MAGLYVQYGCHFTAPDEWLNFDASPTLRWERLPILGRLYTKNDQRFPENVRYGDIVKGLPVPAGSCSGVYASHVLEHLSLNDCQVAVRHTFQLLHGGGIFRVVVPDLESAARTYITMLDTGDVTANAHFLRQTGLGFESAPRSPRTALYELLRTSRHRWMWDYSSMVHLLASYGFEQIRRCAYGDCKDPRFLDVENESRFQMSVAIEAIRPE